VIETIDKIAETRRKRIPTPFSTSSSKPSRPQIRRSARPQARAYHVCAQIGVAPPSFVFFTNVATTFHFSYQRFLVNQLRESFGFVGTPSGFSAAPAGEQEATQARLSFNTKTRRTRSFKISLLQELASFAPFVTSRFRDDVASGFSLTGPRA